MIRGLLGLLGVIALALIVYAGFLWLTSAGNKDQVEKAQQIIAASVIGMIIIFAAFAITQFVLNVILGAV